jgi:DNA-binding IclR family transcriptional regulator
MQAVDRIFSVLRALARQPGTTTLADLARRTSLPKPSLLRLLAALEDQGAVQSINGRYAIGPGLASLTQETPPISSLREIARPHLVELAGALHENVSLTVADDDHTLYLDTAVAESSVMVQDWTGERLPYHASAGGLVLMSTWSPADISRYAATRPQAFTAATVTTLTGLRAKIDEVNRTQVVWTHQEFSDDVNGVGTPITDAAGTVRGALNAYGPSYRFPGSRAPEEIARKLIAAGQAIGTRLG